jgi:metal-responsive CopG/Arc/MetJ family transcriptional regulator
MSIKFALPAKESLVQVSIRVPEKMLTVISQLLEQGGYNRKQRSLWVREALNNLLARPDYTNLVAEEFITPGTTQQIPLSFTPHQLANIQEAIDIVDNEEGVKTDRSAILRTAIIQRILAENNTQLKPVGVAVQGSLL